MNINYKNDPLLTDNDMHYLAGFNSSHLNLYKALLRQKDFESTSVLRRSPTLVGKEIMSFVKEMLLKEFEDSDRGLWECTKALQEYTCIEYCANNKAKYRLKMLFETGKINIIFARVISLVISENNEEKGIKIFNGILSKAERIGKETGHCSLPIKIDGLLGDFDIYLAGAIAGDGHLDKREHYVEVIDGHWDKSKLEFSSQFIKKLETMFREQFKVKTRVYKKGNAWVVNVYSKWVTRLLNHFFDLPIGDKCNRIAKPKILTLKPEKEGLFWRGIFDTDGKIREKLKGIGLKTSSKELADDLKVFLKKIKICPLVRIDKKGNIEIYICSKDYLKFLKNIGFEHPRKFNSFSSQLKEGPKYLIFKGTDENFINKGFYTLDKRDRMDERLKLPLKPTKEVLEVVKYLRAYKEVVYIRLSDNLGNASEKTIADKLERVANLFGIKPIEAKGNRKHNRFYLCSKALSQFLTKFHCYEKPWKPLNNEEITQLNSSLVP